eukprot:6046052-Prymnesium_polylepis.3
MLIAASTCVVAVPAVCELDGQARGGRNMLGAVCKGVQYTSAQENPTLFGPASGFLKFIAKAEPSLAKIP